MSDILIIEPEAKFLFKKEKKHFS